MALSNDLISQFVKTTKTKQPIKKETIVYGTIQKNNDGFYCVKIDGSEILTPISTTTVVAEGDKVTVMIKDHTAIVTGNLSSPSARVKDTVDVDKLNASNARIDNLEVANANVQNTLTASNAKIGTLETEYLDVKNTLSTHNADIVNLKAADATITNRLTAAEADIDHLQALDIDVETLNAAKAFIEDLKASDADIDYLVSTVAEIDNLIFGSATGNVSQTSFSNAIIAQLSDAQIKSAMIDSVSASKITAGDIITNNVHVKSTDGRLVISDETLQISDDNRVRVQIGKDASNDYSINIWDQNGNLMFSKGGITDAAIKEAIIRDNMISDNANIHANKLNIDSLFEEINNGSNTIKSTKIYLDDLNQTLDVEFKTLSRNVNSQGTAISTIQGQISSKIWQQDINTAKNEMSTQYSTLEQNLNGFKTTVSETYATVSDLDNLEIGGRNLLRGTNRGKQHWSVNGHDGSYVVEDYADTDGVLGVKLITNTASTSWNYGAFWMGNTLPLLLPETDYILTFDMLTDVNESLNLSIRKSDGLKTFAPATTTIQTNGDEKWHKYTFIMTTNDLSSGIDNQCLYFSRFNTVGYRIIKNLKLEKGNKATDWTPASEDIENRVLSAETKISQNSESISLTATNLATNYSTTTQMNAAIEIKANAISSTVSNLQTDFNNLSIGGRNLYAGSGEEEIRLKDYNGVGGFTQFVELTFDASNSEYIGKEFTISLWAKSPNGTTPLTIYNSNGDPRYFRFSTKLDDALGNEWKYYQYTFTNKDSGETHTGNFTRVEIYAQSQLGVLIKKLKVELGNKATDWSPAPENIDSKISANRTLIEQTATDLTAKIESSAKTATNYLNFSSSGLVIGDLTSSTLGKNVLIDSDSVDIRNGDTTLASFGADYLYLAKNSRNATIELCDGLAKMYHQSRLSYDTLFVIETPNATEIRGTSDPLCVTSTVASKPAIKFANKDGVLGSIGMVASGTESYITRNHPSTAATYSILDTGNYYKLMDSGWFNGGVLGDNFTVYNDNSQVKYRKIGKQVQIMGTVKPRVDIEGSTTQHTIFTLPSGYRPPYAFHQVCYGSNNYTWRLTVNTNGTVCFSRYGLDSGYVTAAVGHWINFQATFFID